jgi:hydroxypyruvate isomerase
MYQLSPNVELLFTEAGPDLADRIRAAAAAGFDAVEMWGTSSRDVDSLAKALADTGISLTSMIAEPRTNFTLPGTDLAPFFDGLDRGIEHARLLGCPRIVLGSGVGFPGAKRAQNLERLVDVFTQAVERTRGSGVKLVLEPVNTRVDHPGALLDRTADAVTVARGVTATVGPDSFGILYDLYHSVTEGEDPATELANAAGLVDYVQIADVPGRGEPGSGGLDWSERLPVLRASGYDGPIGLEYVPTVESVASVALIRTVAATA